MPREAGSGPGKTGVWAGTKESLGLLMSRERGERGCPACPGWLLASSRSLCTGKAPALWGVQAACPELDLPLITDQL